MAKYIKQTGISLIIAEKEDGTYDVNMGSTADLPQDGLPVMFYTGILGAVCDYVEEHNMKKTHGFCDSNLLQSFQSVTKEAERFFNKE